MRDVAVSSCTSLGVRRAREEEEVVDEKEGEANLGVWPAASILEGVLIRKSITQVKVFAVAGRLNTAGHNGPRAASR